MLKAMIAAAAAAVVAACGGGDKGTNPQAVSAVALSQQAVSVNVGSTVTLTAQGLDASGAAVGGRTTTWTTDNASVATVANGVVTGVSAGTARITATIDGKSAQATVTVVPAGSLAVTGISPDTLTPGASVTITGSNFGPGTTVTVGDVAATVSALTATQLTVTLASSYPCRPTQPAAIVVNGSTGSVTVSKPLRVATRRSLEVGGAVLVTDAAQVRCNELPKTGGRYLVSVYSTSTSPSATSSFELGGAAGAATASGAVPSAISAVATPSLSSGLGATRDWAPYASRIAAERAAATHLAMLERDRALAARLGRLRARGGALRAPGRAAAPVPLTVGAMTTLRVRAPITQCRTFNEVRARVVYVGSKSVVLEDSLAPLAGTMDGDYQSIGQTFDNVMYPLLTANFGDPLAADPFTDDNGKILMLFTPKINAEGGGLLGFVSPCDLYPPEADSSVAASNRAEIFYAVAPGVTNSLSLANWRSLIRGTVMHESKHLAADAERLTADNFNTLEESWLEEGTAQVALELYARTVYGTAWKSNATYAKTVYCDVRRNFASGPCTGAQYLMADPFFELVDYFKEHETKSYLSSAKDDITIYGSAWLFSRWVTDQYASTESAFLKSLVTDATRSGVPNVVNKTGQPYAVLNGWFTLSNVADDFPGLTAPSDAKYTLPSWNLPDMWAGLHPDFPSSVPADPVVKHAVTFGSFTVTVQRLAGGAAAFIDISGTQGASQLLDLHATGGAVLPASTPLRIGIVRVQ